MNMNDLFDRYVEDCLPEVTQRVQRDYRGMLNYLRVAFGNMEPQDVKPRHVADFINAKTGRVQRNRMVMLLSMIFKRAQGSWAIDMDLQNPCIPVRRHPTVPRDRYVTDEELDAFRATAPAQIQVALDLALLLCQRQSDIVLMRWDQIRTKGPREDWEIWVDQGKTGKKLAIGVSPAVEAVLQRSRLLEPQFPPTYVIRNKFGRAYTPDSFRALWQKYMRKWMKAGNPNFHFHDMRAKAISDNPSLEQAYLTAGHISHAVTRRVYDRGRRRASPLR